MQFVNGVQFHPAKETTMTQFGNDVSAESRRRGLTLMELVVVLVILIALAGVSFPCCRAFDQDA